MHRSWITIGIVILGVAAPTFSAASRHLQETNGHASVSAVSPKSPFRQAGARQLFGGGCYLAGVSQSAGQYAGVCVPQRAVKRRPSLPTPKPAEHLRQVTAWRVAVPGQRTPAFNTPAGVAIDGEGAIYVADTGANRIQKISPNGKVLLAWGGHLDHPGQIAADLQDHIYVVDKNNGRLQAFTSRGQPLTSFHPRYSSISGLNVAADPHGQVYIFDKEPADSVCRCMFIVRVMSAAGRTLSAWRWPKEDAQPSTVTITGLAMDTSAHVYLSVREQFPTGGTCDNEGSGPCPETTDSIQKWSLRGRLLWQGASANTLPSANNSPYWGQIIGVDRQGMLIVSGTALSPIVILSPSGVLRNSWGRGGCGLGKFTGPVSAVTDLKGHIYIADEGNATVQKLTPTGRPIALWGGCDAFLLSSAADIAIGTQGILYTSAQTVQEWTSAGRLLRSFPYVRPLGIALDAQNNLYAAVQNGIEKLSSAGTVLKTYALPQDDIGETMMANDVAVDSAGNIYVTDDGTIGVVKLSAKGQYLGRWAIPGNDDWGGNPGGELSITVTGDGTQYVLNPKTNLITKFSSKGKRLATWGAYGSGAGQLGDSESAAGPYLTSDLHGNVYVPDPGNQRIQEFSPTGKFLAQWSGIQVPPVGFDEPSSVAVDARGNIYVLDPGHKRIQELSP